MTERVDVPRRYHRSLLGDSRIFVHDIERKTGCRIRFPDRELALDHVDIFGPEAAVHIASSMLLVSPDPDSDSDRHPTLPCQVPRFRRTPYLTFISFFHLPLYSSHNLVLYRIMCRSKLR
jgi:KH domain